MEGKEGGREGRKEAWWWGGQFSPSSFFVFFLFVCVCVSIIVKIGIELFVCEEGGEGGREGGWEGG